MDTDRGGERQLELEAIKAQNKARLEADVGPLTKEEEDKIPLGVKKDLSYQFESQVEKDKEIEKKKVEFEMIMDIYMESGFMEKGRWGWEESYELESRLDILMKFKDKLLRDPGRKTIKLGSVHNEGSVSLNSSKPLLWAGLAKKMRKKDAGCMRSF